MKITGAKIKELGYEPRDWWGHAISEHKDHVFKTDEHMRVALNYHRDYEQRQVIPLRDHGTVSYHTNLLPGNEAEVDNLVSVQRHMDELMRLPNVVGGAIMPDACPAGQQLGTIPVGGVIAAKEAIYPGMHSADICCSMAISIFKESVDPTDVLDEGMNHSHFGPGGRTTRFDIHPGHDLINQFFLNPFLRDERIMRGANSAFATQGDGNHFFYVGRIASSGKIALVTHHGSRNPGALLYAAGMKAAEKFRARLSPETPKHNAWIPSETKEGEDYWNALQLIREWTNRSHFAIHDVIAHHLGASYEDRFWNEHNFVFRKTDGLFYHAKGATPAWDGFSNDSIGLTLIPLNMAEPILITKGLNASNGLGFAPHGAGRNFSRTAYMKQNAGRTVKDMIAEQAPGIDVRYFSGNPDISELPGAYKNAAAVREQIDHYGLAEVVDQVLPIGNIMAGDHEKDAPWRIRKDKRAAEKAAAL